MIRLVTVHIIQRRGRVDERVKCRGCEADAYQKLLALDKFESVYDVFQTVGKAMLMSMGGASGVIFGSMYLAGAKGQEQKLELEPEEFAAMERRSLDAIKERGKARIGDKTMVDALEPAVIVMEESASLGYIKMLQSAEAAAREGVENTKNQTAKFGWAKSLMERAIGYQDAGATSVWLIFQGMREFLEKWDVDK